ncbi:hypothetical protein EJ110_NYTH44910 [Nymphaea thermarum]|nr:hypothetical protein EJ110_NYTH44910 [Nymphaea thermarum]
MPMMGVYGAGLTHSLFLRPGSVLLQVIPLGADWVVWDVFRQAGSGHGVEGYNREINELASLHIHNNPAACSTVGRWRPSDRMSDDLSWTIKRMRFLAAIKLQRGTAEWWMRNWEDGQTSGAHPSRIIQPVAPLNQNYGEQEFHRQPAAACLYAHAGLDPALLRIRTHLGHRPSPIIIPATHELSAHLPLHRRFPATSPISTGSNLSCRALPMPVKGTINAKRQDDDVVVMEGVVVTSSASTGTWPRSSPAGAGSLLLPTLFWSTSVLHKTEMCRSWEETGACGYGARCKVSRPLVLSTHREVAQNEEEKKIMPQTAEFEAMVDAFINPKPDVAHNKRRLPFAHGRPTNKPEVRPMPSTNKPEVQPVPPTIMPKVSRPRVLSTPREVAQNEEEKKIMPYTAEFKALVDSFINPKPDVARNKRRLPIFVSLTNPTQREYWLKVGSKALAG